MSKVNLFLCSLALFGFAVLLTGCPAGEDTPPPPAEEGSEAAHDHEGADHDHGDADHEHADGDHEHAEGDHDGHDEDGHEHAEGDHDGHDEDGDDHAGHDHGDGDQAAMAPEVKEALAQLSDEDRAAAEAQKICPVTGEALGSMGKPCKVTVTTGAGVERTVFLCCEGCETEIKEAPDKHLAKLDK